MKHMDEAARAQAAGEDEATKAPAGLDLERLQREGKAFLLCPTGRAKVGRLERDPQRLEALYLEGRKAMLDNLPALREFLAK